MFFFFFSKLFKKRILKSFDQFKPSVSKNGFNVKIPLFSRIPARKVKYAIWLLQSIQVYMLLTISPCENLSAVKPGTFIAMHPKHSICPLKVPCCCCCCVVSSHLFNMSIAVFPREFIVNIIYNFSFISLVHRKKYDLIMFSWLGRQIQRPRHSDPLHRQISEIA